MQLIQKLYLTQIHNVFQNFKVIHLDQGIINLSSQLTSWKAKLRLFSVAMLNVIVFLIEKLTKVHLRIQLIF